MNLYDRNGLITWTAEQIQLRQRVAEHFATRLKAVLREMNPAWTFHQIEAPILTPNDLINPNYTEDNVWFQDGEDLVLRPETTPGSYSYAQHLLDTHSKVRPPFVVWQMGKSFRREQDQVTKNMRLKEFYQQELQCFYTADTFNDYHAKCLEGVRKAHEDVLALPTRVVESDRLPSYSLTTMDVEVDNGDQWMEVCSISKRTDFEGTYKDKDMLVLEIAIGLDRMVFNIEERRKVEK